MATQWCLNEPTRLVSYIWLVLKTSTKNFRTTFSLICISQQIVTWCIACMIWQYSSISVKNQSHVTNGVLEFYLNSEALHLSKTTVTCHKCYSWILLKFGSIASLWKNRHVTYGVIEIYFNSGALHFSKRTVTCHIWWFWILLKFGSIASSQ